MLFSRLNMAHASSDIWWFGGLWNKKQIEMIKTNKQTKTNRLASNKSYEKSLHAV